MRPLILLREPHRFLDRIPGLSRPGAAFDKELLIDFEDVEELILSGELLAEDDLVVVDEMFEVFGTPSFAIGQQKDLAVFLDVARLLTSEVSTEDRVDPFQITAVHDHLAGNTLPRGLPFGNHHIRQAERLCHRTPARLGLGQRLEDTGVLLVELEEGMVLVIFRIALPSSRRSKLTKAVAFHFQDEQPVHRVKDQKVALAAGSLVVHVVEAPAYCPALAEAAEFVRDLDLGYVAFLGGTVVEPAGHAVE